MSECNEVILNCQNEMADITELIISLFQKGCDSNIEKIKNFNAKIRKKNTNNDSENSWIKNILKKNRTGKQKNDSLFIKINLIGKELAKKNTQKLMNKTITKKKKNKFLEDKLKELERELSENIILSNISNESSNVKKLISYSRISNF